MDERAKQIEALIEDLITEARGFGRVQQAKANLLAALIAAYTRRAAAPAAGAEKREQALRLGYDEIASHVHAIDRIIKRGALPVEIPQPIPDAPQRAAVTREEIAKTAARKEFDRLHAIDRSLVDCLDGYDAVYVDAEIAKETRE